MDQAGDDSNHARSGADNASVPSCPAGPDDLSRRCDMCHDQFEQFYNEETEEWHLRLALKIDDKFYHPICYEDYKVSPPKIGSDQEDSNDFLVFPGVSDFGRISHLQHFEGE